MYLNRVMLVGNLTRDPELKALPTGSKVANFSLATNRIYKDATGAKKEEVEFHNVVVFGKQAENSALYLKKGQSCMIEGRIQTRSWDDTNGGGKKYRTEIVAETVQFGQKLGQRAPNEAQDEPVVDYGDEVHGEGLSGDDIPF